jgi:hypothetical protein
VLILTSSLEGFLNLVGETGHKATRKVITCSCLRKGGKEEEGIKKKKTENGEESTLKSAKQVLPSLSNGMFMKSRKVSGQQLKLE